MRPPGSSSTPWGGPPTAPRFRSAASTSDGTSAAFFPAVAVKVDDVYIGTHASQNQVLFDFDRVEIKRGPQGAFEGAPAIGGTIGIYRNQPTGQRAVKTLATVGDHNRKRLAAMANIPVGGRFATRASFTYEDGGDYVTNIGPDPVAGGRGENNEDRLTARAAFRWQQDENLALRYTADITRDRADRPARANISTEVDLVCDESEAFPNCSFDGEGRVPETGDFLTTTQNFSNVRSYDVDQHAFHIDFDYRGHQIRSVTAWRDTDELSAYDIDGSYDNVYSSISSQNIAQFTQEVTATRQWSETIDYTAGLFYLGSDYDLEQEDFHILPALDAAGRILDVTPDASRTIDARQETTLISFFAHADYQASAQWKLDAGIRWTDVERRFADTVSRIGSGAAPPPAVLSGDVSSAEATGTLGATYRVDDHSDGLPALQPELSSGHIRRHRQFSPRRRTARRRVSRRLRNRPEERVVRRSTAAQCPHLPEYLARQTGAVYGAGRLGPRRVQSCETRREWKSAAMNSKSRPFPSISSGFAPH
ncbi:MAG: TonB-dependent receptor [Gammaproteobacteria bacterium]|nr:TonB-dependent receptor [Gammaproteobacteria bacterium]